MRLFVRLSLVGLVALVAIGFAINSLGKADSSTQVNENKAPVTVTDGECTESGISLSVDFGTISSTPSISKCVSNFTGTSWDLFSAAGLTVIGTEKYPIGFVCRIEDFPDQSAEPCLDTPDPKLGSWAYFTAQSKSSSWQYSTWGAATHKPACGSAEAWVFRYPDENLEETPQTTPKTSDCAAN
jgi:hypothetical protein